VFGVTFSDAFDALVWSRRKGPALNTKSARVQVPRQDKLGRRKEGREGRRRRKEGLRAWIPK
jgi:hypothetical protein